MPSRWGKALAISVVSSLCLPSLASLFGGKRKERGGSTGYVLVWTSEVRLLAPRPFLDGQMMARARLVWKAGPKEAMAQAASCDGGCLSVSLVMEGAEEPHGDG